MSMSLSKSFSNWEEFIIGTSDSWISVFDLEFLADSSKFLMRSLTELNLWFILSERCLNLEDCVQGVEFDSSKSEISNILKNLKNLTFTVGIENQKIFSWNLNLIILLR